MNKLECMDSADRERLWPEMVHGFKDLSRRMKVSLSWLGENLDAQVGFAIALVMSFVRDG